MIRRALFHATSPGRVLWCVVWAIAVGLFTGTFTDLAVGTYFVASLLGFFLYSLLTDWREQNKPDEPE